VLGCAAARTTWVVTAMRHACTTRPTTTQEHVRLGVAVIAVVPMVQELATVALVIRRYNPTGPLPEQRSVIILEGRLGSAVRSNWKKKEAPCRSDFTLDAGTAAACARRTRIRPRCAAATQDLQTPLASIAATRPFYEDRRARFLRRDPAPLGGQGTVLWTWRYGRGVPRAVERNV